MWVVVLGWLACGVVGCRLEYVHQRLLTGVGYASRGELAVSLLIATACGPVMLLMCTAAVLVHAFMGRYFR